MQLEFLAPGKPWAAPQAASSPGVTGLRQDGTGPFLLVAAVSGHTVPTAPAPLRNSVFDSLVIHPTQTEICLRVIFS